MLRYLRSHPYLTLAFAAAALSDALACVWLRHEDWIFPALVAFTLCLIAAPEQGQ